MIVIMATARIRVKGYVLVSSHELFDGSSYFEKTSVVTASIILLLLD